MAPFSPEIFRLVSDLAHETQGLARRCVEALEEMARVEPAVEDVEDDDIPDVPDTFPEGWCA